jgi:hypothetical protein
VSLEAFVYSVGERPDNCACSCTAWLQNRDFVLIKSRGEMQVSNPARISRAISQWRYTGDRFCNTGMS